MSLNYDIDILPSADPEAMAIGQDAPAQVYFAAFRSPETTKALRNANKRTRAILSEAGVAPHPYSSGTPEGHFPLRDAAAREHLMTCMVTALQEDEDRDPEPDPSGFDLSQVLIELSAARPYGALVPLSPPSLSSAALGAPKLPMPVYVAISVLSCAGYVAGSVLL